MAKVKTSEHGEVLTLHNEITEVGLKQFFNQIFITGRRKKVAYSLGVINQIGYIDKKNWSPLLLPNQYVWPYKINIQYQDRFFSNPQFNGYVGPTKLSTGTYQVVVGASVVNSDYVKIAFKVNATIRGFFMYGGDYNNYPNLTTAEYYAANTVIIFPEPLYTDQLWVIYAISVPIQ